MLERKNKAILFIHGGPGLSSSYFKGWFNDLEDNYDLIFYDQNYNIHKGLSITTALCRELKSKLLITSQQYDEIVVFAHSWGVYILLKSIEDMKGQSYWKKINKFILTNPSDTDWANFCESGDKLFAKMSEEEMNKISSCVDGVELMKLAMPYYVGSISNVPDIEIDRYDMEAYDRISEEMEYYNVTDLVKLLPSDRTYTIYCENDFESITGSPELGQNTIVFHFSKAGHFPFAEYQEEYMKLIKEILAK